jgi:hypothetical protein
MWNDTPQPEDEAITMLDQFTSSEIYQSICNDADGGDKDSMEALEDLSSHLGALCFHLHNESGPGRVQYELNNLRQFIELFNGS